MIMFTNRFSPIVAALVFAVVSLAFAHRSGLLLPGRSQPGPTSTDEASAGAITGGQAVAVAVDAAPRPPPGLPPVPWPDDNPYTPEKAALGKQLFFDPRLSSDGSVSCARCHDPANAFTDGAAVPLGIAGQRGHRSAPTIINRAYSTFQFWDGRAGSLEAQVAEPLANPIEMTSDPAASLAHRHVLERLQAVPGYVERFQSVFGTAEFSLDHVARAIATFERTVLSGNSPFDRYLAGEDTALTPAQVRGMDVFFKKAACDRCHLGPHFLPDRFYEHDERTLRDRRIRTDPRTGREVPEIQGFNLTDGSYQNTGIGMDRPDPDLGRYLVTHREEDKGAFKTPTLREIEHTAPYMHDGSLKTLEDVVEHYDRGGIKNPHLSPLITPLHLTAQEKHDLVAFLRALSGEGWQRQQQPITPPEEPNHGNDRS
jgi:cytochrome c peroxidase